MTKRVLTLLVAGLAAALLTSCASSRPPPVGIYGNPPAMEDYIDNLGTFEPFVQTIAGRQPTAAEYRTIAQSYREQGFQGLAEDDVRVLLAVSQMVFVSDARTLRYSATAGRSAAPDGGTPQGHAVLEEVYEWGEPLPGIAARRVTGENVEWPWALLPRYKPLAPHDDIEIYRVASADSDSVVSQVWNTSEGGWTCAEFTDDAFGEVELSYLAMFALFSKGKLQGQSEGDGRAAYQFVARGQSFPVDVTYWLDTDTLWLRQFQYEEDGIRYTVKLEAINEDIRIEPPNVNVPCVQE